LNFSQNTNHAPQLKRRNFEPSAKIGADVCPKIPEVYWKVVYNPLERSGFAVIVYNSPCPFSSPLLTELNSSPCKNKHCATIWNEFGSNVKPDMLFDRAGNSIKGQTYCCKTIRDAYLLFRGSAENEIDLLPDNVKRSNITLRKS
jgi:hypothetical protein